MKAGRGLRRTTKLFLIIAFYCPCSTVAACENTEYNEVDSVPSYDRGYPSRGFLSLQLRSDLYSHDIMKNPKLGLNTRDDQ